jgi:hypothetical protein
MDTFETTGYESILRVVCNWPAARRLALVQDVLKTLAPEMETPRPRRKTLEKALGFLATGQTAPSDAEIQKWLDEHRMEKCR